MLRIIVVRLGFLSVIVNGVGISKLLHASDFSRKIAVGMSGKIVCVRSDSRLQIGESGRQGSDRNESNGLRGQMLERIRVLLPLGLIRPANASLSAQHRDEVHESSRFPAGSKQRLS